jgi:hypothetical protein
MKRHLLLLLCLPVISASLQAQPHLSGNLSGSLGPGSYIVDGNCIVQPGATLTILPGTTFLHSGAYTWSIYGQLLANGTAADSIKWIRQNPTVDNRWGGLRFMAGASNNCALQYCVVDDCFQSGNLNGGGVYIQGVSMRLSHTRISCCVLTGAVSSGMGGSGLYAANANVIIDYCLIVDNHAQESDVGGGIYLENCPAAVVRNCIVAYNSDTGS